METTTLPAAIHAEKRSNWPFLSRFALAFAGIALFLAGNMVIGALIIATGIVLLGFWANTSFEENHALLESLTQAELMSMIGRDAQTWRSTDSVVRVLDRRFPNWRTSGSAA